MRTALQQKPVVTQNLKQAQEFIGGLIGAAGAVWAVSSQRAYADAARLSGGGSNITTIRLPGDMCAPD